MQISAKLINNQWVVTVVSGTDSAQWINSDFNKAIRTAHAKLLNKMAAHRTIIISPN